LIKNVDTMKEQLQQRLGKIEHPEHAEKHLRIILGWIQEKAEFSDQEWIEVLEELKTEVEFREAEWLE